MDGIQKLWSFFETDLAEAPVALDWSACGRWLSVINVDSSVLVVDTLNDTEQESWTAQDDGEMALSRDTE